MTNHEKIEALCKKHKWHWTTYAPGFYQIVSIREDFDMGFHSYQETEIIRGNAAYIISQLEPDATLSESDITLAEATWIGDLLRLPSDRVDDVRSAVNRVLKARQE